jgi:hypothetical protein
MSKFCFFYRSFVSFLRNFVSLGYFESYFPKHIQLNFEIAILFSVIDFQIKIMFLRRTLSHSPQGKGCKLYPGTYKVCIESVVVETSKNTHSI